MRKERDSIGKTRSRPGEVGVRINREDTTLAHGWQLVPALGKPRHVAFLGRACGIISAWHDDNHVCARLRNLLRCHFERGLSQAPEHVFPAGAGDHLRNPVAAHVIRVQPLKTQNARAGPSAGSRSGDRGDLPRQRRCERVGFILAAGRCANAADIVPNFTE